MMGLWLKLPNIDRPLRQDQIPDPNTRYIVISGKVETLHLDLTNGLWTDDWGTIWALPDDKSADPVVRCGVGFFSFSTSNPLTSLCATHDYYYSSPTWQYFHTRFEADTWLYHAIENSPSYWRILAMPMYYATRLFGGMFWENPVTKVAPLKIKHLMSVRFK